MVWGVGDDLVVIDAERQLVQPHAIASEVPFELRQIEFPQIVHGLDGQFSQFFFGDLPTPGKRPMGSGDRKTRISSG